MIYDFSTIDVMHLTSFPTEESRVDSDKDDKVGTEMMGLGPQSVPWPEQQC